MQQRLYFSLSFYRRFTKQHIYGIVLAIRHELGIPIKYVGLGEGIDDLEIFDIEQYLYGLFAEFFDED